MGSEYREETIGGQRLILGDSIEIMSRMPAGSVDLVVTSPPYNLKNSTGNGMKDGRGSRWQGAALRGGYEAHSDDMPHEEYVAWQRGCLSEMLRLLPENGAIFYNHKWRVQAGILQDRQDIVRGFPVRQIIIWQRAGGINFNAGYFLPTYEVVYMICKPDFRLAPKANVLGDVWTIPQETNNPHPAPFPVELAARCINATTAQTILDPFMGSGSTAIASENAGRRATGIELSPEYFDLSCRRLEAAIKQRERDAAQLTLACEPEGA
jgi:modification methylase